MAHQADKDVAPSIGVSDLSYAFPDGSPGLKQVFLDLPPGSRTLLIGGLFAPYTHQKPFPIQFS